MSNSNPERKYVAYLSVLSQISNCQGLGRKNKFEILKTDRMIGGSQEVRGAADPQGEDQDSDCDLDANSNTSILRFLCPCLFLKHTFLMFFLLLQYVYSYFMFVFILILCLSLFLKWLERPPRIVVDDGSGGSLRVGPIQISTQDAANNKHTTKLN